MTIRSEFIREQKRYSKDFLKNLFDFDDEGFIEFVKKLKAYGVLKMVNVTSEQKDLSDLVETDLEIVDIDFNDNFYYVFTFVGILTVGDIVLKCYPKYLLSNDEPFDEMKEILKVLTKYDSKEHIIHFFNGYDEQKEFNLLAIMLYLIRDYNDYGVYLNQQEVVETNGEGEILWDNTINDTLALIINNRPFYTELQTVNSVNDESNYISRLHRFIISDCCQRLKEMKLLDIFEIDEINISDESIDDFGEDHYILYKLFKELNMQYVTRKQVLLKTLYSYIAHRKSFREDLGLSMYGTNSFNLVWEKVCAQVFDNQLSTEIGKLNLPTDLQGNYKKRKDTILSKIIDKPKWKSVDSEEGHPVEHTLTPDIVSLLETENGLWFCIFDAKYYNIVLNESELKNQPGVGDVTKQYLYQLAYNDFIDNHSFSEDDVKNAFLMPSEKGYDEYIGKVEIEFFKELSNPPLKEISVIKLSARKIYSYYLNGDTFHFDEDFIGMLKN